MILLMVPAPPSETVTMLVNLMPGLTGASKARSATTEPSSWNVQ
jgi:hypothetical protein